MRTGRGVAPSATGVFAGSAFGVFDGSGVDFFFADGVSLAALLFPLLFFLPDFAEGLG